MYPVINVTQDSFSNSATSVKMSHLSSGSRRCSLLATLSQLHLSILSPHLLSFFTLALFLPFYFFVTQFSIRLNICIIYKLLYISILLASTVLANYFQNERANFLLRKILSEPRMKATVAFP